MTVIWADPRYDTVDRLRRCPHFASFARTAQTSQIPLTAPVTWNMLRGLRSAWRREGASSAHPSHGPNPQSHKLRADCVAARHIRPGQPTGPLVRLVLLADKIFGHNYSRWPRQG